MQRIVRLANRGEELWLQKTRMLGGLGYSGTDLTFSLTGLIGII